MPQTLMGVVYDIKLNAVRRVILPDDDREVLDGRHVCQGEAMIVVSILTGTPPLDFAEQAVQKATGRWAMSGADVLAHDAMSRDMGGILGITLFT